MKLTHLLLSAFAVLITSCGPNHADDPLMQKAFAIHKEAFEVKKEIAPKMENLIQIKNRTNVQGRALTEAEIERNNKIDQIEQSLEYWKKNFPEVPGFHLHHDGPCNHGSQLELLPEDWVKVQQEFKDSILVIKERIEKINI